MKNWLKRNFGYITSMYFGGILGIADVYIGNWEWWVIVVPVILGFMVADKWQNELRDSLSESDHTPASEGGDPDKLPY